MINIGGVFVVFLSLLLPILVLYLFISIAIDARAIRRLLERQERSGPGSHVDR
jgi:hypothetical protein